VGRDLQDAVVVITGASSGIGRCAAIKFARCGSRLVLAGRDEDGLRTTMSACGTGEGRVRTVATDVRHEPEVQRLADSAVERFGRIDVWVNDAGVIAYGPFERIPSDTFRAVIETNLMGQVNGSRAALRQFRRQGGGTLINVASVWGRVTTPDVSSYVTSKFALRAFSECLRQELADEPDIHVVTVLPQAVDTPIFENAANHAGRRARPIPPVLPADEVAEGILRCAREPAREVTYRRAGRALELLHSFAPALYARTVPAAFSAGNYMREAAPESDGNLFVPRRHAIDGGWRDERRRELLRAFWDSARAALGALLPRRR
jgi:NAD(P)-dependent dehydrogenase (short-subunit alcohol dehydrogenase family)